LAKYPYYMLDSRNATWLSRLESKGPNFVSLLLAALIAVEAGRIVVALVSRPVKSPRPVIAASMQLHPSARTGVNAQAVAAAHLFGKAVADPTTQDPANAPLSSANLVLAGTIATQDPKRGIAIINDGGPSKVYAVGENVNGATLYSVYLDHVILDRGGTLETLQLPRLLAGGGRVPLHAGPAVARTSEALDNVRRMVQQDPGLLDQVMRTVPSYDNAAGKLRGFRAYPGRNRSIFNKLGLKPGDLVTAINGQPLDDPQHSQEVFNTIQSSNTVTVSVERGGQKQDITLNVAQVASDASKDLESEPGAAGAAAAPAAGPTPTTSPPGGPAGAPPAAPPTNENPNE
jgi:general secretion pathway protein C